MQWSPYFVKFTNPEVHPYVFREIFHNNYSAGYLWTAAS